MFKQCMKSTLVALVLVGGVGAAQAEGLYAGGSLGTPDYKSNINGVSGNGSGVGGKLYAGYAWSPSFAVEGSLFDLGHIDDASGKVNLRGASVDAVGRYAFAPKWSVLGRLGLAEGRFTTTAGNDSSPAIKLGAGLEYTLSQQVALRAEYEHYRFSDAFDAKPKVGALTFGVQVGF